MRAVVVIVLTATWWTLLLGFPLLGQFSIALGGVAAVGLVWQLVDTIRHEVVEQRSWQARSS